jgi:TRAP-type C4-dicarboxylate transport system substrate-binding protein
VPDFSTLCRRQKTLAVQLPYRGSGGQNFHQAAPYVTRTDHLYSTVHISINEDSWQSLSAEQQDALQRIATEATEWGMQEAQAEVQTVLDGFAAEGATISEIETPPFQQKVEGAVASMEADGLWREGLWSEIQDL